MNKKRKNRHTKNISQEISGNQFYFLHCPDRVIFKGHNPLSWPNFLDKFLSRNGILIKDFKKWVIQQSESIKANSIAFAESKKAEYIYLNQKCNKEELVRKYYDPKKTGLFCVLSIVESASTFRLESAPGRPALKRHRGKCTALYFYFNDPVMGLMYVRIQTWLPYTVQVYVNGHHWLEKQMIKSGIRFKKSDNCFTMIEKPLQAQRLADKFQDLDWVKILDNFSTTVNPLMKTILKSMSYYWVSEQFEFSSDFYGDNVELMDNIRKEFHDIAGITLNPNDILGFFDKKHHGNSKAQYIKKINRNPAYGQRIKFITGRNVIKMYDKAPNVIRFETVINDPKMFKVRAMNQNSGIYYSRPMAKRVGNLPRLSNIAQKANISFFENLISVQKKESLQKTAETLAKKLRVNERSVPQINPADTDDLKLLEAVKDGNTILIGFQNKDIRKSLFNCTTIDDEKRMRGKVTRLLSKLHKRGLIIKIPHTRRWRVSATGNQILTTTIKLMKIKVETILNAA